MTFDPTKPVQTRDGRKARIICTNKAGAYSIVSLIWSSDGEEFTHVHNKNGESCTSCDEQDLINIPEKRCVNIYSDGGRLYAAFHLTRALANNEGVLSDHPPVKRIACLEFTEGQGL